MSTRGTYSFEPEGRGFVTTMYIHFDNYPSGAARYFEAALERAEDAGEPLPSAFFRANEGAEFTMSHDAHGDTQYRYKAKEIKGLSPGSRTWTLDVYQKKWEPERWDLIYSGSIEGFIEKHEAEE